MYCQKVHTSGFPLQLILDMSGSSLPIMAKWLGGILKTLQNSVVKYNIQDSSELVERIKHCTTNGKRMLSLDVSSLFTSVPLLETVNFVCQMIDTLKIDIGLPSLTLNELLLRCLINVEFLLHKQFYRQTDGVAMGCLLGPFLAEMFMPKLEKVVLKDVIAKFGAYVRHMDNTLIICERSIKMEDILSTFNNAHDALSFTGEAEQQDCIAFLDVCIERRD